VQIPQFGRREYRTYKLSGRTVLANAREAWWLTEHGWRMLDENDAFMNAIAVPEREAEKQLARLPPLPPAAFSSDPTVH
jgi:hypothetical protein